MKVILLEDIEKLGKKYEVKEVKDGYARNFLIPKGMAKLADKKSLERLEAEKELAQKKAEEELKKAQKSIAGMEGLEVMLHVKVGEEGQLFESITAVKISEKLKEMGFNIDKKHVDLEEPIKELGEFPVKISFEHNLESEIRVIITEENEK